MDFILEILKRVVLLSLNILSYAIIIRAILSWLPDLRNSQIAYMLDRFLEPIFAPIRRITQRSAMMANMPIDLSPLVVLIIIHFLRSVIRSGF